MKELKERIEAQIEHITSECQPSAYGDGLLSGLKFALGCVNDSIRRRTMFRVERQSGGTWSIISPFGFPVLRELQTESTARTACDKLNGVGDE